MNTIMQKLAGTAVIGAAALGLATTSAYAQNDQQVLVNQSVTSSPHRA